MKKSIFWMLMFAAMFMGGCSTITGYQPVVNERADKFAANVAPDLEYCHPLALKAAGLATNAIGDTLTAASGSAAVGAISGAVITGTVSAGIGAAAGAGIGGIAGLWYGLYESDETYKRAFNACMSQLGHPVLW